MSLSNALLKLPYLLADTFNLGILESGRHKLLNANGFTLITPNLSRWETFLAPRLGLSPTLR